MTRIDKIYINILYMNTKIFWKFMYKIVKKGNTKENGGNEGNERKV